MSLLSQPLFSARVRTGITRPHLVSFPLHLQAAQRGNWKLAPEQLQGHLLATHNLYTIVEVLVMAVKDICSKCVEPIFQPISNNNKVIFYNYVE